MGKQSLKCLAKVIALGVVLGTALSAAQPVSAELKSTVANKKPAVTAWGAGTIANDYLATVAKQTAVPEVKKEVLPAAKRVAPMLKKEAMAGKKTTAFGKEVPVKADDALAAAKANGKDAMGWGAAAKEEAKAVENKLSEKLNNLNADNAKLSDQLKRMNGDNAKLSGDVQKLTEENAKLSGKLAALNVELTELKAAVAQQNVQFVKMMNKQDMKFTKMKLEQDSKLASFMQMFEK